MCGIDDKFIENFMGLGEDSVKFLGHGVGLSITDMPVIANRFDESLEENMVMALESKNCECRYSWCWRYLDCYPKWR